MAAPAFADTDRAGLPYLGGSEKIDINNANVRVSRSSRACTPAPPDDLEPRTAFYESGLEILPGHEREEGGHEEVQSRASSRSSRRPCT